MTTPFEDWIITSGNKYFRYDLIQTVGRESRYSSLLPRHIDDTVTVFRTQIPTATSMLDGTAHIGVDSLNFLNMYPTAQLTAVEINPNTVQVLARNMGNANAILNKSVPTPKVLHGSVLDFINAYQGPKFTFVYLDPPWGGPDYKDKVNLDLQLGESKISDIIPWILSKDISEHVVVKLPNNADLQTTVAKLGNRPYTIYNIANSYLLLFVK